MRRGEREGVPYFEGQETANKEVSETIAKVEYPDLPISGSIDESVDSPNVSSGGSDKIVESTQWGSDGSVEDVFSGRLNLIKTQDLIEKIIERNSGDE